MKPSPLHFLYLEDDDADFVLVTKILKAEARDGEQGVTITRASTTAESLSALKSETPDAIICDLNLPDSRGIDTVEKILAETDIPLVVLSGEGDHLVAEQAVQNGAQDFLEKDGMTSRRLWRCLHFAMERTKLQREWERVREAAEEQRRFDAIGRLTGGIAHEINNTLGIIRGFTETLIDDDKTDPRETLRQILKASDRVADLIKRLTQLGGRAESAPTRVEDLGQLVERSCLHLRQRIPNNCKLGVEVAEHCFVRTSELQVEQILANLVINAVEAVGAKQGLIKVKLDREDQLVRLAVTDNGAGISSEIQKQVFDPYFTTKADHHSGLGLSIVNGILNQADVELAFESSESGTTFTCFFPVAKPEIQKPEMAEALTPPEAGGYQRAPRVLVADDEECLRMLLDIQFTRMGFAVVTSADGKEAVDLFKQDPEAFDLIVSDVLMPNMDGPTFIREAHQLRPDMPVIFVTGFSAGRLKEEGWYNEHIPVLTKPYDIQYLKQTVESVLHV